MGSLKRAELRRRQREQEKKKANLDNFYRQSTAELLESVGVPEGVGLAITNGIEKSVQFEMMKRQEAFDEEVNKQLKILEKNTRETVEVLEAQICRANMMLTLRAVELAFGHLKTVQHGWDKFFACYDKAVSEAEKSSMKKLNEEFQERTGIDFGIEDDDWLDKEFRSWKIMDMAAEALGEQAKEVRKSETG